MFGSCLELARHKCDRYDSHISANWHKHDRCQIIMVAIFKKVGMDRRLLKAALAVFRVFSFPTSFLLTSAALTRHNMITCARVAETSGRQFCEVLY